MGQRQMFDVYAMQFRTPTRQADWDSIAEEVASFHPLGEDVVVAMGSELFAGYSEDCLAMFGRRTPTQRMPGDDFQLRGARVVMSNDLEEDEALVYHLPRVESVVGMIRAVEEGGTGPMGARPWKRMKKPKEAPK